MTGPYVQTVCRISFQNCIVCGVLFTRHSCQMSCSDACRRIRHAQYERTRRKTEAEIAGRVEQRAFRRRVEFGEGSERFAPVEVYERDGWVCGICTEAVDPELFYPDPMSASLDHVDPVSLGGQHTRANTRCAHLVCNQRRGNRAEVLAVAS